MEKIELKYKIRGKGVAQEYKVESKESLDRLKTAIGMLMVSDDKTFEEVVRVLLGGLNE